jgi:predicted AlkP superfamily phosphohydrolase/phosphomutase
MSAAARRASPLAALLLLATAGCRGGEPPPATGGFERAPILLVGADGFEWNVVLPLLRQGKLPALASLMRRGSYGTLATIAGAVSPALWTTIATGKTPEKHGIRDFLKARNPPVFFTSADRRTKAFWNIYTDQRRTVDAIGWFVSFPVEPISGVMVAQANTRENQELMRSWKGSLLQGVRGQVHPAEREAEIFAIVDGVDRELEAIVAERLRAPLKDVAPRDRAMIAASQWAFRADTIYERTALELLKEGAPDLLAVYFGATDVVAHRFWPRVKPRGFPGRWLAGPIGRSLSPHMDPGSFLNGLLGGVYWRALEPQGDPWAQRVINHSYEHVDEALGRMLQALPARATVVVVSDHGFRPWGHEDGPDAFFVAAGPSVRRRQGPAPEALTRADLRRLGSILDVTPTLLALQAIPVARDMDGRVLDTLLVSAPGLERPPPVATHDTPEWLAGRSGSVPPALPPEAEAERLEQLRALGYVK